MSDPTDLLSPRDALLALAVVGDLSMGQPIDHSLRVAVLSERLATLLGLDPARVAQVAQVALLRWAGCTANASEIAKTIGDDVAGRAAMLALQFDRIEVLAPSAELARHTSVATAIHCEVSSLVAEALALSPEGVAALRCVFEHWDGSGRPEGLAGEAIPPAAMMVAACSELEIFARTYDLATAFQWLLQRAGSVYPLSIVRLLQSHAAAWLDDLDRLPRPALSTGIASGESSIGFEIIGHVIDLKLPWLTGHSRAVVTRVDALAAIMNLDSQRRATLRQAAWLHGLGRVAIPNALWCRAGRLTAGEWERVRLVPYWTSRALGSVLSLAPSAELASHAFERLDGSGYFRGLRVSELPVDSCILAAAVAWVALRADRPWRPALPALEAMAVLERSGAGPRFDADVLSALAQDVGTPAAAIPERTRDRDRDVGALLTPREIDVLRRISLGDSNKAAARRLDISPSTVRTHLENIFRKLGCQTRAAATLRASLLGLLGD